MAENKIKTIGVLTSGGDAPGMNAAIRAVVRRGLSNGLNVKGILKGYNGLLNEEIIDMSAKDVSDTIERGGTILYTARCAEFRTEEGQKRGAEICRKHGIDGLVVIGGDGSFAGAQKLANLGINTIGLPGTIDLDIACTEYTIGFDTAVNTAMEAIDKVRDTSTSHERCSIIEVMGRGAGYIALWCGIANGAEDVLVPEKYDYDEQKLINNIIESRKKGKKHHIIINAEGIGHSTSMARRIEAATGIETRATIIGHIQRGGTPTCKDRVYASIMGARAAELLAEGKSNRIVAYKDGKFVCYCDIAKPETVCHDDLDMVCSKIPGRFLPLSQSSTRKPSLRNIASYRTSCLRAILIGSLLKAKSDNPVRKPDEFSLAINTAELVAFVILILKKRNNNAVFLRKLHDRTFLPRCGEI